MKQTIYYKPVVGRDTRDTLRNTTPQDQAYLRRVMECYQQLAITDPRPEFAQWFDMPNNKLPRQPQKNNERNTPRTFCQGIIDKLNQAPNRRDLSPKQCEGIEALSQDISEMYTTDHCPSIEFKNKLTFNVNPVPEQFTKLFQRQ